MSAEGPVVQGGPGHAEDLEELLDLYEHAPCGYLTLDAELRVLRVNETFLELTGRRREDVVGRTDWPGLLRAGDRILFETHARPMVAAGLPVSAMAVELPRADGTRVSVLAHLAPRKVRGRTLVRVTVFDARERRAYERELLHERDRAEASARQLRTLFAISSSFDTVTTVDGAARAVTAALTDVLGCADADVWTLDGTVLTCIASTAGDERAAPFLSLDSGSIICEAVRRGEVLPLPPDGRVVPLRDGAEVVGAVVVLPGGTAGTATDLSEELLRSIGQQAGLALGRAARFEAEAVARARAEQQAMTDALTGIANRRFLDRELDRELARSARDGSTPALALIDIDRFKVLNDRYGHQTGDDVIVAVAHRLRERVRVYDVVARWGGEEFAVLLRAVPGDEPLSSILEGFRAVVAEEPVTTRSGAVAVSVSVGGARWRPWWRSAADLLSAADRALYRAKDDGRNRVVMDGAHPAA